MRDIYDRLEEVRSSLRLSYAVIAKALQNEFTPDGINKAIKNKRLSKIQIDTFADFFNVNINWLENGEGKMLLDKNQKQIKTEVSENDIYSLLKLRDEQIRLKDEQINMLKLEIERSQKHFKVLDEQLEFIKKLLIDIDKETKGTYNNLIKTKTFLLFEELYKEGIKRIEDEKKVNKK